MLKRLMRHRWTRLLFLGSLLLCLWLEHGGSDRSVATESHHKIAETAPAEATQWLQQGLERYQNGDLKGAIAHWQTALHLTDDRSPLRATTLHYLVQADQQVGAIDQVIAHLEQLIVVYRQTGNTIQVGRMQTEQAQAYSSLGQQRKAIALLCGNHPDRDEPLHPLDDACSTDSAIAIARRESDTTGTIAALGSLGNAYRLRGVYDRALEYLQTALTLATQIQSQPQRFAALNGLGNTYASLAKRDDRRRQYAQQSADESAVQAFAQNTRRYDHLAIASFEASLTIARAENDAVNELRSLLNLLVPLQRSERSEGRGERSEGRGVRGEGRGERGEEGEGGRQKAEGGRQEIKGGRQEIKGGRQEAANENRAPGLNQNAPHPLTPSPPHPLTPSPPHPHPHPPSPLTPHSSPLSSTVQQAQMLLTRLPASREKAYAAIRLATLTQVMVGQTDLERDPATHCLATEVPLSAVILLQQAIAIAQQIGDSQSEAFALGRLGHVYECRQNYEQALSLTQQAQLAAANLDSRYLWEWQAGRLLRLQQKTVAAIASYKLAVKTLQTIRGDLAIASRDFQFDFRDAVEPVYRELTALYLEQATNGQTQTSPQGGEASLELATIPIAAALETMDGLRLAELQNYLGDDCTLNAIATPVTVLDQKTAVLSSVRLGDRVAVILTLPSSNQPFHSQMQWLPVSAQTVQTTVNDLRHQLEKRSDLANTYQKTSRQVYDWLIAPFAQALQQAHIETLVFMQDGILRSLPMAALYDGKQFLVEQYAIASTLSLTLVEPTHLDRQSLRVLGFGLTQPAVVEGPTFFAPLSYVKAEIDGIQAALPGSKGLFDAAFTLDRLQHELAEAYPIVHLATHGRFGMDARETFLVMGGKRGVRRGEGGKRGEERERREVRGVRGEGMPMKETPDLKRVAQNYNETLTMNALYQMLRLRGPQTLELLTLTACETAVGSDRDALGIAGLALQAGARSTVASLWQVDDQATAQLITHFYQSLKQGMSRAKALQAAQKNWLQQHPGARHHPGYWAALILVGNWL